MNIKDYLHLYLGCEVETVKGIATPMGTGRFMQYDMCEELCWVDFGIMGPEYVLFDFTEITLILRPLSDMTKEEAEEYGMMYEGGEYNPYALEFDCKIGLGHYYTETDNAAERIRILLSKHFDLFGLIEAGLAIDKTTFIGRLDHKVRGKRGL